MIFFDIDNTLIDHKEAEKNSFKNTFFSYPFYSCANIHQYWHELSEEYYQYYIDKKMTFQEQGTKRIIELFKAYKLDISVADATLLFSNYLYNYENSWVSFDDVYPTLNTLSKYFQLGIISNGDYEQQIKKLKYTNIYHYFSIILISSEVGYMKPDIKFFKLATKMANKDPDKCFYIGDHLINDFYASQNSGFNAILINRDNIIFDGNQDIKSINNMYKLTDLIKRKTNNAF